MVPTAGRIPHSGAGPAVVLLALLALVQPPLCAQGSGQRTVSLPRGDVFGPLIADPRQPQFLAGAARIWSPIRNTTVGAVALGENFGVIRWAGGHSGDGIQISIAAGAFAQFDLLTPSNDLINTDYLIGVPLSYRRGHLSLRAGFYHQSSHLGDEFVLSQQPIQRINLSYEFIEALIAIDGRMLRAYGGGELLLRREPTDLRPAVLRWGVEYRSARPAIGMGILGKGYPIAGLDLHAWQQHHWSPGLAFAAGLEFRPPSASSDPGKTWSLRLLAYTGPSPYGQFYSDIIRYAGAGITFGF